MAHGTVGQIGVRSGAYRVQLTYETWGSGPPVLLIHGMGSWRRIWEGVVPQGSQAWALDLPGFGDSGMARRAETLDSFADAVDDAVRLLGLDRPFVAAHSFGAMVAVRWLRESPAPHGLLLVAPAGFIPPRNVLHGTPWYWLNRLLIWLTGSMWFGSRMAIHLGLDPTRLTPDVRRSMQQGWRKGREMARMGPFYAYPGFREDVQRIEQSGTPLHIWLGRRDPLFPGEAQGEATAGLPVKWLDGVGHVPMLQDPDRFVPALREILALAYRGEAPA